MSMTSQRKAYGEALVEFGKANKDIVVLEADLGKSTMSCLFEKEFSERFFEVGIAEANMIGTAAGLSLGGKIPFCNSFAVFLTNRAFDQIRQSICIAGLHVILAGSSAGFSDFGDGSTHQTVEDFSTMRALPNMMVLSPADATEAKKMVEALLTRKGPAYLRICRSDMPDLLDPAAPYTLGNMIELKKKGDIAIFATGIMVSTALNAAEALEKEGVHARVINVGCLKPLDTETLFRVVKEVKGIVTVEEHSLIGGLGSTILEALCDGGVSVPTRRIGVKDTFGCSGHSHQELLEHYGLTATNVAAAVRSLL